MKRQNYFLLSIITILMLLAACGTSEGESVSGDSTSKGDSDKVTLKLSSFGPDGSPWHQEAVVPWMERVTDLTEGAVEFDYYPAEQLGKADDFLQLTQNGVADISALQVSHFSEEMPLSSTLEQLPHLYENSYLGTIAYDKLAKSNADIQEIDYANNDIKFILAYTLPPFSVWTKSKEVRVPSDLKGAKIRSSGKIETALFEHMGATPVSISFSESYEAMERGVVDTVVYAANPVNTSGVGEVVGSHTPAQLGSTILSLSINQNVWEGLSEEVQDAMMLAAEELEEVGKVFDEAEEENLQAILENGAVDIDLTEEEDKEWEKLADDFTEEWLSENNNKDLPYESVLEDLKEIVDEHR